MLSSQANLTVINQEQDPQAKLAALVRNGFVREASEFIWDLVRNHTAMFHCDWHDARFCHPLPRVTRESSAVYVIITSNNKFDYHPSQKREDEWHVIFELGWERTALDWSERESQDFAREIFAQALARPLNQWSFKQAEGMGRAARWLLPTDETMAREVAALHLVYHLREANFGHICNYLKDIPEFSKDLIKTFNEQEIVNWIVDQLIRLGWTEDHIRKELVEWIHLKTGTWPQWLLAVAKAKVFKDDDIVRRTAVRRWLRDQLMNWIYRKDVTKFLEELLVIGEFSSKDHR